MGPHRNKGPVATFDPVFEEMKARSEQERFGEIMALQDRVESKNEAAAREIQEAMAKPRTMTDDLAQKVGGANGTIGKGLGGPLAVVSEPIRGNSSQGAWALAP